jgi:hypothetical protein
MNACFFCLCVHLQAGSPCAQVVEAVEEYEKLNKGITKMLSSGDQNFTESQQRFLNKLAIVGGKRAKAAQDLTGDLDSDTNISVEQIRSLLPPLKELGTSNTTPAFPFEIKRPINFVVKVPEKAAVVVPDDDDDDDGAHENQNFKSGGVCVCGGAGGGGGGGGPPPRAGSGLSRTLLFTTSKHAPHLVLSLYGPPNTARMNHSHEPQARFCPARCSRAAARPCACG